MSKLIGRLASLEPKIRHFLEWRRDGVVITLMDATSGARVSRLVICRHIEGAQYLDRLVIQVVNDFRRRRSLPPLGADAMLSIEDDQQPIRGEIPIARDRSRE
jgi:hypothetical protein